MAHPLEPPIGIPDTGAQRRIAVVIGTRPEAIKLAPVVLALQSSGWAHPVVVLTGQHADLVAPVMAHFGLTADENLQCMTPGQSLAGATGRILQRLDDWMERERPDALLAQGDTVSVLAAGLASFFRRVPFGHVEAGLRTGNPLNPFPEEMNRRLTSPLATWHFAPTETARENLLREGVPAQQIWSVGNTVIDALLATTRGKALRPAEGVRPDRPLILVTAHRRESFGEPMRSVFRAVRRLAEAYPGHDILVPLHPNPIVREAADLLRGVDNIRLVEPLPYPEFCWALQHAELILSDSGGVQEEAPALGRPVLVLRDDTERPEAVAIGANRLVGTDEDRVFESAQHLLEDRAAYERMAKAGSPYGDGTSAQQICEVLRVSLAS